MASSNKIKYIISSRLQFKVFAANQLVHFVLAIALIITIWLLSPLTSHAAIVNEIEKKHILSSNKNLSSEVIKIETNFSEGDFFEINNPNEVWRVVEKESKHLVWRNQDGIVMETYDSIILPPILELHPDGKMVSRKITKLAGKLNLDQVSSEEKLYGRLSFKVIEKFNQQEEEWNLLWVCESRGLTKVITKRGIIEAAKIYCLRNGIDEVVFYYSQKDKIVVRIERTNPTNGQKVSREIVNWQLSKYNKQVKSKSGLKQNSLLEFKRLANNKVIRGNNISEGKVTSYSFSQQIPQSQGNIYNKYYSGEEAISPDSSDKIYDANKSLFKARIITIEPFADPISRTPREDDPDILRNKARGVDLSGYDRTVDRPHVNPSEVYPDGYYNQNIEANNDQELSQRINLANTSQRQQPQFSQNSLSSNNRGIDDNYLSNQDPLFQSRYPAQNRYSSRIGTSQQLGSNTQTLNNNQDFRSNPYYQRGFAEGYNQAQNLRRQNTDSFQLGLDASLGDQQTPNGSIKTNLAVDQTTDAPINVGLPSQYDENLSFTDSNLSDALTLNMKDDPDFFQKHLDFIQSSSEEELREYLLEVDEEDEEDLISLFDTLDDQSTNLNSEKKNNAQISSLSRSITVSSDFDPNSNDYFDNINQVYSFTGKSSQSSNSRVGSQTASLPTDLNFNNNLTGSVAAHLASYVIYSNLERGWMIYQKLYNNLLKDYNFYSTEIVIDGQKYYRLFAKTNKSSTEVIDLCRNIVSKGYYCMPRRI